MCTVLKKPPFCGRHYSDVNQVQILAIALTAWSKSICLVIAQHTRFDKVQHDIQAKTWVVPDHLLDVRWTHSVQARRIFDDFGQTVWDAPDFLGM